MNKHLSASPLHDVKLCLCCLDYITSRSFRQFCFCISYAWIRQTKWLMIWIEKCGRVCTWQQLVNKSLFLSADIWRCHRWHYFVSFSCYWMFNTLFLSLYSALFAWDLPQYLYGCDNVTLGFWQLQDEQDRMFCTNSLWSCSLCHV